MRRKEQRRGKRSAERRRVNIFEKFGAGIEREMASRVD